MSADYDRLFHSSGASDAADEDAAARREGASPMPVNASGAGNASYAGEHTPPPMPIAPTQAAAAPPPASVAPPPSASEVTSQIPVTGPQHVQNRMMRTPQTAAAPLRARARAERALQRHGGDGLDPVECTRAHRAASPNIGGHHGQSPGHRRAVTRRGSHSGQDAVATRLATLALSADADQHGPVTG